MRLLANTASWFIIIGSASLLLLLIFFYLLLYQYYRRRLHHANELHAMRRNYDQALLQSQLEIQEQTYSQISEEIHDNIGQVLSLVKLNINTLDKSHDAEKITTTDTLLAQAIADLRNLSHLLHTAYIKEAGFAESVQELLMHMQKSGQYQTRFQQPDSTFVVDGRQAIILFRMVQEIVNNSVRHAGASAFCVTLEQRNGQRRIILTDDGRGFDTSILEQPGGGLGIRNMKLRAASVGAAVNIDSAPSRGTTITITLNA
jgi:signal transduction histidine kinase